MPNINDVKLVLNRYFDSVKIASACGKDSLHLKCDNYFFQLTLVS